MTIRRRALRLAAGLAAALLLISGCSGGTASKGAKKVRFTEVIHSVFYAPQYIAQAKGYFSDEGIELDFSTAQGSDKGTAAVLAGTADIALVGPETTVFVYNQDTQNKVKMFAQITSTDGSFLLARKADPQFKWSSLKGKSVIGWRVGSMPQLAAAAVLQQQGLAKGDVDYISNLAAPAMAGAFQSGQADFIQVLEPVASQLEQAGVAHVVASIGETYGPLPYTGYIASDMYIAQNPDVIQSYTNAIYRAMRYLETGDPAVIAKEIAPLFEGLDPSLIESSIRRYKAINGWKKTPVMVPAEFDKLQELMVQGGVLDAAKKAPFEKITINTFAETAVRDIR